jgi:hypothetical protein
MFHMSLEVQQLTGYVRAGAQIRWLRKNGWLPRGKVSVLH